MPVDRQVPGKLALRLLLIKYIYNKKVYLEIFITLQKKVVWNGLKILTSSLKRSSISYYQKNSISISISKKKVLVVHFRKKI